MPEQYNVVVLIFDTLRSDYLSCYGAETNTPAFEAAAGWGTLFESAFSVAPGTPISHASMYTGQYPSEHGVTGQYLPVPEDRPVLAEWFRDAGYDTFGITGPAKMGSDWGYDRGFDELFEPYYDLPAPTSFRNLTKSISDDRFRRYFTHQLTRGGHERTRFKFDLLRDRIEDELASPFFALGNFTTAHAPYDPPRPYKQQATPELSRPRTFVIEHLFEKHGRIDNPAIRTDRVVHMQTDTADGVGRYLADPSFLNLAEVRLLRDWYRATVEYLDVVLGQFLRYYRRELQDDTILVLTADHGEQLGEHGLWEHSHYLYDETLQVPLIVVGPELPVGSRRSDFASHVDLFQTLCDCCGLDVPETTSGLSLVGDQKRNAVFMEYGKRDTDAFATESPHGKYLDGEQLREITAGRKAIRTDRYRLELDSNGRERLFDLPAQTEHTDPSAAVVEHLRRRLLGTLGERFGVFPEGDPESVEVAPRARGNLERLGYVD